MGAAGCGGLKSVTVVKPFRSSGRDTPPRPSSPSNARHAEANVKASLLKLEGLVSSQPDQLGGRQCVLPSVQRDSRRTVSVLQYNILASYLGENTQPWFLYGADVSQEDRRHLMQRFQAGAKWPEYAEGILSQQAMEDVERRNEDFRWDVRQRRLLEEIRELDADVVSLVELDRHARFAMMLGDTWDSVFHKRPQDASLDGCGIFWRRSKFLLEARYFMDLVDGADAEGCLKRDRSCLMVLLKWRGCGARLVVVSTHLAKDPDNRAQTAIRVRQVTQIMQGLTEFTVENDASDTPVILMGDLNAEHLAEIRGLARTVWQINGSPIHKFLWSASDVPTGLTSITEARRSRIDVVQFLSSQLEVVEVLPMPRLRPGDVIPNAKHPSDHFPVFVCFRVKDDYQKHKECARAWLECVAGREKLHPLTEDELNVAFEFFDRDRNGEIHRHDLEEACFDLECRLDVDMQQLLLECFPRKQITYVDFVRAYEVCLNHERMRCIGELESAFQFFANNEAFIHLQNLEAAFREITPISFSDDEVKEMIRRLGMREGQELVDLHSFCEVVAHATFPQKRPCSPHSVYDSDCDEDTPNMEPHTKELAGRLDKLNEALSRWNCSALSPVIEEKSSRTSFGLTPR